MTDSSYVPRLRFGTTDLFVTRLCQGTAFRNMTRESANAEGESVLRHCLDAGVNFFDSSIAYGWGGAEQLLGKAIAGRRDQAVICTKRYHHRATPKPKTGPENESSSRSSTSPTR